MPLITSASTSTSSDGQIAATVDSTYGGVLLQASLAGVAECRVSFMRTDPDGTVSVVRGGDHARLVDGFAVAYDAEMPLADPLNYWLVRHDTGVTSQPMTVTVPQGPTCRLLAVTAPGSAVSFFSSTYGNLTRTRNSQVLRVVGRPDPIVLDDARSMVTFDFTAMIQREQTAAFNALLDIGGTFLFQPSDAIGLDQMYVRIPQDVQDGFSRRNIRKGRSVDGAYLPWTTSFVQVTRPSTVGSPLRIPGKSYADQVGTIGSQVGTYKQRLLA